MIKKYKIYASLLFLILNVNLYSQIDSHNLKNVGAGKHSTIVEVDGFAYISEDKTIKELRMEALTNAKRDALERAQTYIQSKTNVENYRLTYDLIQSQAEGFIKILASNDYGITDDNRYRYWIKAEVQYKLISSNERESEKILSNSTSPLTVYLWTNKKSYNSGDIINIFVQGNKDFYARIVYRDVTGNLMQLLPNPHRENNFFKGSKVYEIPNSDDSFELEVGPPFGIENILLYASNVPLGDVDTKPLGNNLYKISDSIDDLAVKARGVKIKEKASDSNSEAEFFEARCEILIKMNN